MKIRQTIKKAVALGTGALMLGATILGASAANISDYPSAFIKDGKVTAKIVVGEKAAVADVIGAIDIAADLQSKAVSKEVVAGSSTTVTGGKSDKVALGSLLTTAFTGALDYYDLNGLVHTKLSWNDKDIDVDEKLTIDGLKILTSADDPDFEGTAVLGTTTALGAMKLKYIIKDTDMNTTMIGDEANDCVTGVKCLGKLKVNILGKEMEIQTVSGTGTSAKVTFGTANEYYMNVGDSVTVSGKKVTLKNVASSGTTVSVDVDGVIKTVSTSALSVNGIKLQAVSSFYDDNTAARSATLKIGDKITEEVKTGDKMTQFGEPDSSDAEWEWEINKVSDSDLEISANFRKLLNGDTKNVRKIGQTLATPGNYVGVKFTKYTVPINQKVDVSFDQISLDKNADGTDSTWVINGGPAIKFEAQDEFFRVVANGVAVDTKEVYIVQNGSTANKVYGAYLTRDGDVQKFDDTVAGGWFQIINDKKMFNVTYNNVTAAAGTYNVNITGFSALNTATGWVALAAKFGTVSSIFGDKDNEAETGDMASDLTGLTGGTYDNDYISTQGVIITNPKTGFGTDEFSFTMPGDQSKAQIDISGPKATTSTAGAVTTDKVNPIGVDFGVLDKNAPAAGASNLIVVGGPCVNTVAARLAGNPAKCADGFVEGEAKLTMFDDAGKVALLVAGYSAADTQGATRALINEVLPMKSSAALTTINSKQPKFK